MDQMERNYRDLSIYLFENKRLLEPNEFKAILWTMHNMTIYNKKKTEAIKRSAKVYGVTQQFIKDTLKGMGTKSNKEREAKQTFGKYEGITKFHHKKLTKG